MKKLLLVLVTISLLSSCSSDDNASENKITTAAITLTDSNGEAVSGIVIYAYNETTWSVIGDDPQFADFQAASDNDGIAVFSNLTTAINFGELNNYSQTFRFSAHYSLNGTNKIKVKAISFNLGDTKSDMIVLD
ncbi:hypothetical protein [Leeuwenhoekiella sp. MAR_2009_132]|uniref:hypothetical protein n=1 Tax=Leeuwenhoekiella sp. MAR_2009_132 TaxID=1392489 RepID=UPI00048E3CD3|nr:hypothetical protein [Leeuwenhoekiella sp. MAR_2009_132]